MSFAAIALVICFHLVVEQQINFSSEFRWAQGVTFKYLNKYWCTVVGTAKEFWPDGEIDCIDSLIDAYVSRYEASSASP
jgi:hypothetical protein